MVEFYPSISEALLNKALDLSQFYTKNAHHTRETWNHPPLPQSCTVHQKRKGRNCPLDEANGHLQRDNGRSQWRGNMWTSRHNLPELNYGPPPPKGRTRIHSEECQRGEGGGNMTAAHTAIPAAQQQWYNFPGSCTFGVVMIDMSLFRLYIFKHHQIWK